MRLYCSSLYVFLNLPVDYGKNEHKCSIRHVYAFEYTTHLVSFCIFALETMKPDRTISTSLGCYRNVLNISVLHVVYMFHATLVTSPSRAPVYIQILLYESDTAEGNKRTSVCVCVPSYRRGWRRDKRDESTVEGSLYYSCPAMHFLTILSSLSSLRLTKCPLPSSSVENLLCCLPFYPIFSLSLSFSHLHLSASRLAVSSFKGLLFNETACPHLC